MIIYPSRKKTIYFYQKKFFLFFFIFFSLHLIVPIIQAKVLQIDQKKHELGSEQILTPNVNPQKNDPYNSVSNPDNKSRPSKWRLSIEFLKKHILTIFIFILLLFCFIWLLRPTNRRNIESFLNLFFTLVAFCISVLIALIALSDFFVLKEISADIGAKDYVGHILNFTQIMFGFFGLVLAAVTTIGGIFIFWLRKTMGDLKTMHKQTEDLQLTTASNFLFSADLALLNLPDIRYTQQIPFDLIRSLQNLENIFARQDTKDVIWNSIKDSPNGARICYARALYYLALYANDDTKIKKHDDENFISVANLLEMANKKVKDDTYLEKEILIRLFQAYRQINEFPNAEKYADKLERLSDDNHDPQAKILAMWLTSVLFLQKAFMQESGAERRKYFEIASNNMEIVFGNVFGWDKEGGEPQFYGFNKNANIAYYAAKAMSAFRLLHAKRKNEFSIANKEEFLRKLRHVHDVALKLFFDNQQYYIKDNFIEAIYNYCVAFLLATRKSIEEVTIRPAVENYYLFPDRDQRTEIFWKGQFASCLRNAKSIIITLQKLTKRNRIISNIYVETSEKLDSLSRFEEDVRLIGNAWTNPSVLFNFFRIGQRPN